VVAQLNYKHLRYFWAVAKSGSIARAADQLHVTSQSISTQLTAFQDSLGTQLLSRAGRGLELTEAGKRILRYADEIFGLGDELVAAVRDKHVDAPPPFRIGVADSVPKSVTYRILEPVLHIHDPVRMICREGRLVSLLADLAVHRLDMVIADRPMPTDIKVKAYSHLLGSSDLSVFASRALAKSMRGMFPASLDGAPLLMPGESAAIRQPLEQWLQAHDVHPRIVGEFDDGALLKAFGQGGAGLFVAPTAIAGYIREQYHVEPVGQIESVREDLYAISTERRLRHPATVAISEAAATNVFGAESRSKRARATKRSDRDRGRD
jgi:LysR family transcriptional activator of nhaA